MNFYYTPNVLTSNDESIKFARVGQRSARWAVTAAKAKPIYGLGRGSVQIHEPAAIVAARIDQCLRVRSVEATFDAARAEALCKTSNMVQFRISLYAGDDDNGEEKNSNSNSTFLEIVKTGGCGFSFTNERKEIVDAAKGFASDKDSVKSSTTMMMVPDDLLADLYTPPSDMEIQDMLDRAIDQLHSKHDSTVIFALQNLYSMTTSDKYNAYTADQVSKYIVENYNCIRDMIASIYASRVGSMKNESSEQICNLSLDILINGMKTLNLGENCGNSRLDYGCKHFVEMLVPSLVMAVTNYDKNTHTACLAMKCLCLLAASSSLAHNKIGETNARKIVEEAKVYGSIEHLRLEQVACETLQTQLIAA